MDVNINHLVKNLNKKVTFILESGVDTEEVKADKKEESRFEICHINDFTQEQIKAEQAKFDDHKAIEVMPVCAAYHGGPLDYPKVTSRSIGEVVQKWDLCYTKVLDYQQTLDSDSHNGEAKAPNSDEEVYEQLTMPINGKVVDGPNETMTMNVLNNLDDGDGDDTPKNSPEEFYSSVTESVSKIVIHNTKLVKDLLCRGDMPNLLPIVGGLALARNKLWSYNDSLVVDGRLKPFKDNYRELVELVEAVAEQIVEYQTALVATTVLHDAPSQRWADPKPFYEGERISHCIQMWWFYLQGLRTDLWNAMPPKVAQSLFASVFDRSLGLLAVRYTKVSPSSVRLNQYRGDITTLLLISSEALMYIATSTDQLFDTRSTPSTPVIRNIHTKCSLLLEALSLVGSPLHVLYKTALDVAKPKLLRPVKLSDSERRTIWLHLMRPGLFHCSLPDQLSPESHIVLQTKLAANQPEPVWPMVIQVVLSHQMTVAKLILLHFGAFVPGQVQRQDYQLLKSMAHGCKGFECRQRCIGPADLNWPQAVGSGVLKVILHGMRHHDCLIHAFDDLFGKLSDSSWQALDRQQMWNTRRPVWLKAIIHLVEPHLLPVVMELMSMIESGKAWPVSQVIKEVLVCISEVVDIIPIPVMRLCLDIESRMPQTAVRPLADSVLVQIAMSGLYNIVSRLQATLTKARVPSEKLDFVRAFNEALVQLDSGRQDLAHIQTVATEALRLDAKLHQKQPQERYYDAITTEHSYAMCDLTAMDLLSDESGQFALKSLHRFLCYNVDWIQSCMGVSSAGANTAIADGNIPALIKPWGSEIFPPQNPFEMMNQVGDFRIGRILEMHHPWETYLRHILAPPSNRLIHEHLFLRRSEFLIDENDFAGIGSHVTVSSGHSVPISGAVQPDERRMLENTLDILKEGFEGKKKRKEKST